MVLRWMRRIGNECYLTCGWKEFSRANKLKEGTMIRLGVFIDYNSKITIIVLNY